MRQGFALRPPPPTGTSRVASSSFAEGSPSACRHAVAITPAGPSAYCRSAGSTRLHRATASAFPILTLGRLPHHLFRGLLGVHSRYGLPARRVAKVTLCTGDSGGFVASTAAPIATGWSDQLPGGYHPR
jgi:hypothetical protein